MTDCTCRCHAYGPGTHVTCDTGTEQPGGILSCSPCRPSATESDEQGSVGIPGRAGTQNGAEGRDEVPPEERCVLPHPEPERHWIGYACRRHYREIDRRLSEIEMLFALRDELILPGPGSDMKVGGNTFGSPAPGRIELMEVTDRRGRIGEDSIPDVPAVLSGWVRVLYEERDWLPPDEPPPAKVPLLAGPACDWTCAHASCVLIRNAWRRVYTRSGDWEFRDGAWRLPETLSWLVGRLRAERQWIAQQEWLDAYAAELYDVHRALARATGARMWPEPVGRCPNCQAPLYNEMTGADVVTCRKCRASWSGVAWLRLRLIFEQEGAK